MILNLLDRMKLPFRKSKEFLSALYDILGFYPHNLEIYRIAFSHRSITRGENYAAYRSRRQRSQRPHDENTSRPLNNERLEFLGDAVLETVVSDILFHHFNHKREGFLTATRAKIVQRDALNVLAQKMGLERLIVAAQGTHVYHTNIGGNAFEALMGAIYLDRGYKYCYWFISQRVIGHYVDLENTAQKEVNFKSKLLEWSQKNRIRLNFRDTQKSAEERGFNTVITIEGIVLGRGEGRSKKDSQQRASREALTRMRQEAKTYDQIFRAKEKRTAMEAEESFALPKIDEIEAELPSTTKAEKKSNAKSTTKQRKPNARQQQSASDEAYAAAYDVDADFEVIDTPPAADLLTPADYAAKGLPAPPMADELSDTDELVSTPAAPTNESKNEPAKVAQPRAKRQSARKPRKQTDETAVSAENTPPATQEASEPAPKIAETTNETTPSAAKPRKTNHISLDDFLLSTDDTPTASPTETSTNETDVPLTENSAETETIEAPKAESEEPAKEVQPARTKTPRRPAKKTSTARKKKEEVPAPAEDTATPSKKAKRSPRKPAKPNAPAEQFAEEAGK